MKSHHLHETIIMEQTNHKHHRRRRAGNRPADGKRHLLWHQCCPNLAATSAAIAITTVSLLVLSFASETAYAQQQNFLVSGHNMENFHISELTPVYSIVYQLKADDHQNENRKFSYHMTGDTFSVDEQTGEVKLIKPLDRERNVNITVVVSVFDNSDTKNDLPVESKRRTIFIKDVDDSWPTFVPHQLYSNPANSPQSHYDYQANLSEQATINSIVLSDILVTDADEGTNAEIAFECRAKQSTNSACDIFSVESRPWGSGRYNVSIRTKAQLDYEQVQSYRLTLVARGKKPSPLKGVPLESETAINIDLVNVQDEGPVFINAPYSLSMVEGLKNGTQLLNLIVQDGDAAPQRELSMIVVPGPYSQYFQVSKDLESSKIWYLETNVTIDREDSLISSVGNTFTISLLAAELDDSGLPIASEFELSNALREPTYSRGTLRKESITIVVLDLPDSRPVFVRASTGKPIKDNIIVFNISESIVSGASVPNLDLAVHDMDQGINSRFNLSLRDSDIGPFASDAFALESEVVYGKTEVVLNVLNSSLLDYENLNLRSYKFSLVASKNINPPLVQILDMQINVMDANDNSPEFDRDQYIVDVPEGALPGTVVTTIRARDKDSGVYGKIDYMLRGTGASKFKLVSSEGKIIVNDCGVVQCLDYEVQSSFSLTYEARDGGGRTKNVSVIINIIDINDHPPKFTELVYKRQLLIDNLSSKQNYISPQLIVRAKDGDGPSQGRNNMTYRIKSTNLTSLDVDPISGLVYLAQPLDLYNMISKINSANNGRPTDKKIVFEAEVVAEDNGSPMQISTAKILLVVKGNREGAPQFKQDLYQALVRENQPINRPFFQVQAIDPDDKDSQLRYSLGYDLNDLASINTMTGELSFKTKVDFDDFNGVPYNITVYATDNSKPYPLRASAIVSIQIQDVNDKMPKFEKTEYRARLVQGKTKQGDTVLKVNAVDFDKNAQLNYSIVYDQLFVHDKNGQKLILENLTDPTNGYLSQMNKVNRIQLVDGLKKLFQINKKTGAIELKSEPDYSFAASITILVRVVDLSQEVFTSTGELQQDFVNCTFFLQTHVDRNPIFAPPWSIERREYSISMLEELNIGTPIFSLLAKDPSTNNRIETFEKLFESDPKDLFHVERTGVVSVNRHIDYEELPTPKRLTLSVKALTNDIFYSVAKLIIQVVDLNDNAPQFKSQNYSVSVSETVSYPQEILTVSAEDKDSKEFSQVYYSLSGYSSELFTIDPKKGSIGVKKGVKLDRDTEPNHLLLVTASDCNETRTLLETQLYETGKPAENSGCKRSSVFVNIALTDENDNDPVFTNVNKRGEFEALTSETVSIGSVITQALAVDIDEGANGQVAYEIVRSDDPVSKLIKIDRDGYISVAESLSGMGRSNPYRVTVRAFDHGKSSRQSHADLILTISDVVSNDGVPKFIRPKPDEVVNVSENTGPSTFIYQVQATDPDEETNGKLMYKFIQPSDIFEIDPFTGVIKTQFHPNFYLDRELMQNYTLIIVAQDLGSPPKQAHQVLTINITDINDNEPYFEREIDDPPVVLYVEEEVPKDFLVGTIQAIDRDIGPNALIGYEIIEGNHNNLFRLDYDIESSNFTNVGNNPCRIYSVSRLDRETKESYTLTIKASSGISKMRNPFIHTFLDGNRNPFNQYNASDLTKIRVTIKLLDINDNRPVFAQQNAKSVVDSSAEVYSQLMVFKATDADSSNSEIQYSIMDVLYYSDSKFRLDDDNSLSNTNGGGKYHYSSGNQPIHASMRHVFDIDPRAGILRNSVSLRPYIDGYFEVIVKADSGSYNQAIDQQEANEESSYNHLSRRRLSNSNRCYDTATDSANKLQATDKNTSSSVNTEIDNCFVAVSKAIVFVTHQRETFRFVFNKTKLNDRLDEFKSKIQDALEEIMYEPSRTQASLSIKGGSAEVPKAEKIYLNTFNTDFYEREDGSLDFSTLTSCSQLVKFDDRSMIGGDGGGGINGNSIVPNQVVNYDEVLNLFKTVNATQMRNQKTSLFIQYGLVNIERCLPDKTMYKMTLSERVSLYFAAIIALVGILLAIIVSKMRKSYENNLKLLQRSKYQYMSQYATLSPGVQARPAHHMSMGTLQGNNFIAPPYGSHLEYDGPAYNTWQL